MPQSAADSYRLFYVEPNGAFSSGSWSARQYHCGKSGFLSGELKANRDVFLRLVAAKATP